MLKTIVKVGCASRTQLAGKSCQSGPGLYTLVDLVSNDNAYLVVTHAVQAESPFEWNDATVVNLVAVKVALFLNRESSGVLTPRVFDRQRSMTDIRAD